MFRWLVSLFRGGSEPIALDLEAHVQSLTIADIQDSSRAFDHRVGMCLLFFVGKQLLAMGLQLEHVPAEEPYTSKKCRGYLMGVAHGIITSLGTPISSEYLRNTVESAFALVFGRSTGPDIASETTASFGPGSGLAEGYVFGSNEVEAVLSVDGTGITCGCGFDFFAQQAGAK